METKKAVWQVYSRIFRSYDTGNSNIYLTIKINIDIIATRVVDPDWIRTGSGLSDFVDPDPYWESESRIHIQGQEN
jgi:hypothetical protein